MKSESESDQFNTIRSQFFKSLEQDEIGRGVGLMGLKLNLTIWLKNSNYISNTIIIRMYIYIYRNLDESECEWNLKSAINA